MSEQKISRKHFLFPFFIALLLSAQTAFGATKIMPLGDSITGSPGCWRAYLWEKLQLAGYTDIDFVGTLGPQGCAVTHDGDNEGHGGILATNMANQNQLPAWLSATSPDIVLMHLGTNDVWSSRSTESILAAFTKLVQQMRTNNPKMKIIVAQIIPMDSASSCSTCGAGVIALNNALPSWAANLTTSNSRIIVVDVWTGFSATADTYDGVHPTNEGHQKMAAKWYPAVVNALGGSGSSSSSSTTVSSKSSSSISSKASSVFSSVLSSSSFSSTANELCSWYGVYYPICTTTTSGWGYENNKSCIARSTCASQPPPYGIHVVGASSSVSSSTAASSSSTSLSIKSSSSITASSSSKSSVTSSTASSSSLSANALSCVYVSTNSWGGGYQGAIRVTNKGTSAINGWTATWQYSGANRISGSWNANITGTNPYSATNVSWNGNLSAGQTVEFGIQGNTNGGAAETPVVSCK